MSMRALPWFCYSIDIGARLFSSRSANVSSTFRIMNTINRAVTRKPPVAPPVYRPQPTPRVLQTKSAVVQRPRVVQLPRHTVSPPVRLPVINRPVITKPAQSRLPVQMKPKHPLNRPARVPLPANNQTVQPFLIEGLVLGGLALGAIYGGYRYYRHRRRESTIADIRREHAALGPRIVGHVEAPHGLGVTSTATTIDPTVAVGARQYRVFINEDDPVGSGGSSPSLMESARIHERTHIAADQAYTENLTPGVSQQIHHAGPGRGLYHTYPLHDRAEKLLSAIASDRALSRQQRAHLDSRVRNNALRPTEWDSTINELLVYTREEGIRANSSTIKLLVTYAKENLEHRRGNLARLPRLRADAGDRHHQEQERWPLLFPRQAV